MEDIIKNIIAEHSEMTGQLLGSEIVNVMERIARAMIESYRHGGKVILFGNGGSAADAQHIAAELVNKFNFERPMLNAVALTTNTSILTAISNDSSYDDVFARQVESLVSGGDVVIGISTSGKARNVLNALRKSHELGAKTVFFTGRTGGMITQDNGDAVDITLNVPSDKTPRIQEAHILAGHIICELVEEELYGQ